MIRRIGQVTRDSGIMGLLFRVLAQSVYRRLLLLETYLAEHQFDADPRCRWLGPGDEALYEEFALPGHAERLSQRLAAGQRCWILTTHDQKIGHALWVAFGTASIAYLGFDVPLAADEVYLFDSYTPPRFRGRGLATISARSLKAHLRERGIRRTLSCVLPDNRRAYPPVYANGARPIAYIGWLGVGPWRHQFRRRTDRFPWFAPPRGRDAHAATPSAS